jgi:hypothetical protein
MIYVYDLCFFFCYVFAKVSFFCEKISFIGLNLLKNIVIDLNNAKKFFKF